MEPSIDCRAWRTRELAAEEDWIQWEREVSMRLTKKEDGRRMTPLFSGVVEGSKLGRRERALSPTS